MTVLSSLTTLNYVESPPLPRGMVTVEDFSSVMEQLGVYLSGQETEHLKRLFDR